MYDQLTLGQLFEHAVGYAADVPIVTRAADGSVRRYTYQEFGARAVRLMNSLDALDIAYGEVVATLASNSDRHLEAYFAVPCAGRVLHTLNPRLSSDDLAYTIKIASDRAIFVDPDMLALLEPIADELTDVRAIVVFGSEVPPTSLRNVVAYEDLIGGRSDQYAPPRIDERHPLGICFSTGTTGRPKGVTYTHRSTVLHALAIATGAGMALGPTDCTCAMVPMFHANCFGLPHAAAAVGAKQVLYEGSFNPSAFVDLLIAERATFSAAVPTIWHAIAADLRTRKLRLPDLRHVITAGARPPTSLVDEFRNDFDVQMLQAYGMTEASPLVGVAWPKHHMSTWEPQRLEHEVSQQSALPMPLVSVELRDDAGEPISWDGTAMGNVHLRGPWISRHYIGGVSAEQFSEGGWFNSGDIAIGSPHGYITIADRSKDLVKSGGEWISSVDIENAIADIPGVAHAAVIAIPDPTWDERPLACVVLHPDAMVDLEVIRANLLKAGFPRWQLPDRIELLPELPLTAVGKVDKKALRKTFATAPTSNPVR
ncbi:long-chain-fatty-acid--CoA ligase [Mycolicibacterium mucogenicum]|nr:long-chain-fatty-acid--CoA ligase [Mycolicibacterium mucogenicum]